jgi:hypothetical protein
MQYAPMLKTINTFMLNYKIKNCFILFVIAVLLGCHHTKKIVSTDSKENSIEDFTILIATSQDWHGGIKGSGSGTNYEICIITRQPSGLLAIDQLWVGEKFHTAQAVKKFPATSKDGFTANDTVYIHAADHCKSPDNKDTTATEEKNIAPPFLYKGAALIGYKIFGKRMYKTIDAIEKKPTLNYP